MAVAVSKQQKTTTSAQLSLDLFEKFSSEPISARHHDIGYTRNNFFVAVSGLGLASRRFIDAAYFIASQDPVPRASYQVDLDYFKWLMRYESRNIAHLRNVIREAQRVLIDVTDTPADRAPTADDKWISEHLMHTVRIDKGRITYAIPPLVARHICSPDNKRHWLNLCITTSLTQIYARVIYDFVQPFVADGITDWVDLETMRRWPSRLGSSAGEFKLFRIRYLEPGVAQINAISDIEVSYETHVDSPTRKVDAIRFRVKRKDTVNAILARQPESEDLLRTLKEEFGLSSEQFTLIKDNRDVWTDERIMHAIEYTRFKLTQGKVTRSPSGYLLKALTHNWQVSAAERKMVEIQEKLSTTARQAEKKTAEVSATVKQSIESRDEEARAKRDEDARYGRAHFEDADEATRKDLVSLYVASQAGKLMMRRLKVEASTLTDANILTQGELAGYFAQFVAGRARMYHGMRAAA